MAKSIWSVVLLLAFLFHSAKGRKFDNSKNVFSHAPPAMFVFGDSMSDTGNSFAAFPFQAGAENYPYGSTVFGGPNGRFNDGRVIVDFMALKWGFPFIQPYFNNMDPNYRSGANFAVAGATARNVTGPLAFFLPSQTDHFIRFKRNVQAILRSRKGSDRLVSRLPPEDAFKDGIYLIYIGLNDLFFSLMSETPTVVKNNTVPQIISAISKAIQDLHREGAKNFMVFTTPVIGCFPTMLARASAGPFNSTDELGCLREYNDVIEFSNRKLQNALANLTRHHNVEIMVVDVNAFFMDTLTNPSSYGFNEEVKFQACCGHGGPPYNYNPDIHCGTEREALACSNPSDYISWEGDHFTDAFNKRFVEQMMKGRYLKPASHFH